MFNIANQAHMILLIFYGAVTLIIYGVSFMSYRDEKYLKYMRECTSLFIVRMMVRCMDFEGVSA